MGFLISIVGGGRVGRTLANRLSERGDRVTIIERESHAVESLTGGDVGVVYGDGTDTAVLREAGVPQSDVVVPVTGDDDTNLLVAQLVESQFDGCRVISRVNRPQNESAFEDLGITTVSSTGATAWMLDNHIERPAFIQWLERMGHGGDVQEVQVTNPDLVGETIETIDGHLPEQCVLIVSRTGPTAKFPDPERVVESDDYLTVLGERESVTDAIRFLHPEIEL
ncbi:potassium channel family protein [Halobium palmae]|uniref:Potassium channel family protein n=1 Tax=Halobium palmae TaxID=1776492 RepID=A0ABD5RV18_9EURY